MRASLTRLSLDSLGTGRADRARIALGTSVTLDSLRPCGSGRARIALNSLGSRGSDRTRRACRSCRAGTAAPAPNHATRSGPLLFEPMDTLVQQNDPLACGLRDLHHVLPIACVRRLEESSFQSTTCQAESHQDFSQEIEGVH